jgi:hypothetical protein
MGDPVAVENVLVASAHASGWSLLSKTDRRGTVWWFEPSAEIKGNVRRNQLPKVMYHVTRKENIDNIMVLGLVPMTRTAPRTLRSYSPRVYLASTQESAWATVKTGEWVALAVKLSNLPKTTKFFVDQEFGFMKDGTPIAAYVLETIPAAAISIV